MYKDAQLAKDIDGS